MEKIYELEDLDLDLIKKKVIENIKIQNIVITCKIGVELNLTDICNKLKRKGAQYNSKQFPGLILKSYNPKISTSLFGPGKVVCTGAKTISQARFAINSVIEWIKVLGYKKAEIKNMKYENLVANTWIPFRFNEGELSEKESNICNYDPQLFPGVSITDPRTAPVVILVFESGKMVLTGAKKLEDLQKTIEILFDILINYIVIKKDKFIDNCSSNNIYFKDVVNDEDENVTDIIINNDFFGVKKNSTESSIIYLNKIISKKRTRNEIEKKNSFFKPNTKINSKLISAINDDLLNVNTKKKLKTEDIERGNLELMQEQGEDICDCCRGCNMQDIEIWAGGICECCGRMVCEKHTDELEELSIDICESCHENTECYQATLDDEYVWCWYLNGPNKKFDYDEHNSDDMPEFGKII